MASTRRTFLKGAAGMAVLAGAIGRRNAEAAEAPAPTAAAGGMARGLRICNLQRDGRLSLGVLTTKGILDVERAAKGRGIAVPGSADDVVAGVHLAGLQKLVAEAEAGKKTALIAEKDARFGPCISRPEKIMMLGYNYRKHAIERKIPIPKSPVLFNKFNNALNGHGGTIRLPTKYATKFDHEVELVVVIGKTARDVPVADALSYVWGYCTGNDFSARDLQERTTQLMLGKTSDGFAPIGPWLVSADLVGDPQNLKLECRINGEVRQSSNTSDMIFPCAELVSYISRHWTVKPGDIIFTGTPEGVIWGKPEDQQVWLKPGDKVTTEIEKLGKLEFDLAGPPSA